MKKWYLLLIINLLAVSAASANDFQQKIRQGNELYGRKQFEKAIQAYRSVTDSGYSSAALLFNLGNAYYKTNDIKNAILYYERARLLDPGDDDINYNLELARNYTVDKIDELPELFLVTWLKDFRDIFSLNVWTILGLILFFTALAFLLLYLLSAKVSLKQAGFWVGSIAMLLAVFSVLSAYSLWKIRTERNAAIVFTPVVTIKSAPDESGTNLFILHEGTKVQILYRGRDWSEVKIADGNQGYIKNSDMETI